MPLAILTLILSLAFGLAPIFLGAFGGYDGGQLPIPQPDPPIQPAGYAFSIWTVIYVWLIVAAVFGLARRARDADWTQVRVPLCIALAVGAPWIAIAKASAIWGTVAIFVMLIAALVAFLQTPTTDRWILRAATGVFAGWLSAAAFVSLAVTMAGYGIGPGGVGWGYIGLIMALLLVLIVHARMPGAPEYGAAVIWALIGIIVTNWGSSWGMVALAGIGALAVAAVAARGFMQGRA